MDMQFEIEAVDSDIPEKLNKLIEAKRQTFDVPTVIHRNASRIAAIQNKFKPYIIQPIVYVFAGDHGIAAEGLCKWPQYASAQNMTDFANGGGALNVFSRQQRIDIRLIDCGLVQRCGHPKIIERRLAAGTENFKKSPAMDRKQAERCLKNGSDLIRTRRSNPTNTVGFGLQAVGSELAAIMLISRLGGISVAELVRDHPLIQKKNIEKITSELQEISQKVGPVRSAFIELQHFSGFEMMNLLGAILQAAHQHLAILLDGFVSLTVGWIATLIEPKVKDYLISCQNLNCRAGHFLDNELDQKPIHHFDTAVGDGSGVALAYPLVQAACSYLNETLTFQETQRVKNKTDLH